MRVVIAVLALLAILPGCRGRRSGQARARPFTGQNALQQRAEEDLSCEQLQLTPIDVRVVQVVGCGHARDYVADPSRRTWEPLRALAMRAESELRCPVSQLAIEAPASRVRVAAGCGRFGRYDLVCEDAGCDWRMTAHAGRWNGASARADDPETLAGDVAWDAPSAPLTSANPYDEAIELTAGDELELVLPAPPETEDPADVVVAALEGASVALHRCFAAPLLIHAAWDADGEVTFTLPGPLEGSTTERCVSQFLGHPRVLAATPGGLDYTVP
jgi:hypothetical protein